MTSQVVEIGVPLQRGTDCAECVDRLLDDLAHHAGVERVEASGEATVRVVFDPQRCSSTCVQDAAARIGAELADRFRHEVLPVTGMDCPDCARTIEQAVARVAGVSSCSVSFASSRLVVEYEAAGGLDDRIRKQVRDLGYDVGASEANAGPWWRRRKEEVVTAVAAASTVAAVLVSATGADVLAIALYAVAIVVGGRQLGLKGFRALCATHRPDINVLMTIAVVGAVAIGAWLEAALVVVLFRIGENLEAYAVERARRAIGSILALSPDRARRRDGGGEAEVAVSALRIGDQVVVRPGERLPADGVVIEGASAVDEAAITGESVPADKVIGDPVFAGTFNTEGALVVEVQAAPGSTTLDRIARAVEQAQAEKSRAERWVDAFARRYTPAVLVVAVLVATVPPLVGWIGWSDAVYRALAFLILACPCALVIATPVAVVAALGRASSAGVIVKGGAHLEAAASLVAVAFDKTGTLTEGRPRVTDVVGWTVDADEVARLAASLEASSEHPLAKAIVVEADRRRLVRSPVEGFAAERGSGVRGRVGALSLVIGSPRRFADLQELALHAPEIDRLERDGKTLALLGDGERLLGLLALADVPRPSAGADVAALTGVGIRTTVLLTGDQPTAAAAVAAAVGIDDVRAGLLPGDKVAAVVDLERTVGPVAMVGDGVNDAPALARATLGIAMGTAGSPTAIETADVALLGDDLAKVAGFIGLGRWSRAVVRQNVAFALGTKAVATVFALAGLLPLWLAVLTDVGATLLVVANGLRLLGRRPRGRMAAMAMLAPKRRTA